MATCQQVITDAISELGAVALGESPAPEELRDAMPVLQALYDGLVSEGKFGRAIDVLEDAAYTAKEDERVFNTSGSPIVVSYPDTISSEDSEDGEERAVRDYTLIRVAGDPRQTKIYCAPLAAWQAMTSLTLTSYAPLSERDFHGLSCLLAMRLVRRFKAELGQTTVSAANRFLSALSLKSDAPRRETQAEYF